MDILIQDLRQAIRGLARTPGFTLVAVLTLALGIGANTSVFTLVNAALFRKVAAARPDELVWLVGTREPSRRSRDVESNRYLSYPEFRDYRDRITSVSGLMTYRDAPLSLGSGGEPTRIFGLIASGEYFDVLGLRPVAGRFFTTHDDAPGAAPVAVISHSLWQRRFGGDPSVIGRDVTVNGRPFTLLGVAPLGFIGTDLGDAVDMWVPFATIAISLPGQAGLIDRRDATWLRAIGRLKPGVTAEQANAEAYTVGAQLAAAYPDPLEGTRARVMPLSGGLDPGNRQEAIPVFVMLMAVPAVVLLVACANVANLLLARAAGRRREVAIRLALGAGRARLVRQLLTESVLLALVAGGAGMLFSFWIADVLLAVSQVPPEVGLMLTPDGRVLAFTMGLALVTGIVFGLAPAFGATRPDLIPALKSEAIAFGRRARRSRLTDAFVVAQVALSLVLLVTAGLFLRSLGKALRVDPGFAPAGRIALTFDLGIQGYDAARRGVFYTGLLERVHALPGVQSATFANPVPLSGRMMSSGVLPEGTDPAGAESLPMSYASIWPDYFKTMGVELIRGREFTTRDVKGAPLVVIVNETLARRLWPDQDPIGKRLREPWGDEPFREVIGVARDGRYDELTERPRGFMYLPERQRADMSEITMLVHAASDPSALAGVLAALARALHEMDASLPIFRVETLEAALVRRMDKERGAASLLGVFGTLALALASLGLYGVMAYAVTQRTREIGIRMALGAVQPQVLRQFVLEGVRLALVGVAIGLVLAAGLTRVASQFLYGVGAMDLVTFALSAVALTVVAAAASFLPARRASRVDPMVALRTD